MGVLFRMCFQKKKYIHHASANGNDKKHDWQPSETDLIYAQLQTWRGFVGENKEMHLLYQCKIWLLFSIDMHVPMYSSCILFASQCVKLPASFIGLAN